MQIISIFLFALLLGGCSTYSNSFDCPVPNNGIKCQSISEVAAKVTDNRDTKTIYLQQCNWGDVCS